MTSVTRPSAAAVMLLLLRTAVLGIAIAGSAEAAVFLVDRLDDAPSAMACDSAALNDCSLRGAILAANAAASVASEVQVPAGLYLLASATPCTFDVASGGSTTEIKAQLCATAPMKITGAGAASTIIDAEQRSRVLAVSADGDVDLTGVTMRNGKDTDTINISQIAGGGAIVNEGTLRVADVVITDNGSAVQGGAIRNAGALTVERALIQQNESNAGGGIAQLLPGSMTISDTTIRDNDARFGGGGIYNVGGDATIRRSLILRNTAGEGSGGGVSVSGFDVVTRYTRITNSTISGNEAGANGGGLEFAGTLAAVVRLTNVTVTGNVAGKVFVNSDAGGVHFGKTGSVTVRNTVIAGNTAQGDEPPDCGFATAGQTVSLVSEGHNLIGNDSWCFMSGDLTGNILNVDAKLAPIGDNDGPTATHRLLAGSPAIDAGNPNGCTDSDGAALTQDQRGLPRAVDGNGDTTPRCDIGAFEVQGGGEPGGTPTFERVQPRESGNAAPALVIVHGTGFAADAGLKLARSGQADVVASAVKVDAGGQTLVATLDLAGKAVGAWDVVVANPGGGSTTAAAAFTIAAATGPKVWLDLAGPRVVRSGRLVRYVVLYGNRGNTDAFAVPLVMSVPESFGLTPRFAITPPPQQPGKIVIQEWGRFYQQRLAGSGPGMRELVLLLPVVPAGFNGALEVDVNVLPKNGQGFAFRIEHSDPLVDHQGPRADKIAELVAGARTRADQRFKYALPTAIDDDLTAYLTTQLETVVETGRASLVASVGTDPGVYGMLQLSYDLTVFGMVWSNLTVTPIAAPAVPLWQRLAALAGPMVPEACAEPSCCCGPACDLECCDDCLCTDDPKLPDPDPDDSCHQPVAPGQKDNCRLPEDECLAVGYSIVGDVDNQGHVTMICTDDPRCARPTFYNLDHCVRIPVETRTANDPNDKSGPAGGGPAHAIRSDVPLGYTIRFENKKEATAPAADVVITDQLDPTKVDLATLALGPMGFGDRTVTPPPGLAAFTTDVDLRPAMNLAVRVEVALDAMTNVLTWRFTSLDPITKEPPADTLAGFLPPNVKPPEGDGYVSFTVDANAGVTTGAQIANQARIFFDANDPIDTPLWANAIDDTAPTSQVVAAAPVGGCSRDVDVGWSGTDAGAGIAAFAIEASEDGGPFAPWTTSGATSGVFHGKSGTSYVFRSLATDLAGNVQTAPSAPSPEATVPSCDPYDLAVVGVKMPPKVKLLRTRPTAKRLAKITIQNRGVAPLVITDAESLGALVTLTAESLGSCGDASVTLHAGKPQKPFPIIVAPKKKANVVFDVLFECVHDPQSGKGHEDYRLEARVHQDALGGTDAHAADDVCPRRALDPIADPFPDGKIKDKGCGGKDKQGLGAPILVDVVRP